MRLCALPTDVFNSGIWSTFKTFQHPSLKQLAEFLQVIVLGSRAQFTTNKYLLAYQRWVNWAQLYEEITSFPAQPSHIALYLQHLADSSESKSAVEEAVNAISWVHQLGGYSSVAESPLIRAALDGFQRKLAKPKVRKEPVTRDMMQSLVESLGPNPSLSDVRLVAACLLAYSAFLCYDGLLKLRCCDVSFHADGMSLHIASSKTDQYRQGDSVLVVRSGSRTCPVAMLERYFLMAKLSLTYIKVMALPRCGSHKIR